MGKFTKWIAGGLGWAFLGPLGGIAGFVIGSVIDETSSTKSLGSKSSTTPGGYVMSLLVLVAAVMKADNKVMRSELNYVKQYFVKMFGEESAAEAIKMLKDILNRDIPLYQVCDQIRGNLDYSSRLQLLHFLFGVASADGRVHERELDVIEVIASRMGLSQKDKNSIKSMFIEETGYAYKILEVDPEASNEEVKKAYRKMANKYHPDKVSHLGEDFQEVANQKFQKVNDAYEKIKKERNMN